jgi:tetratricopeptide (TPR) repeat protein
VKSRVSLPLLLALPLKARDRMNRARSFSLVIIVTCTQAAFPYLVRGNDGGESVDLQCARRNIQRDPNNPDLYLTRAALNNGYLKFSHALSDADRAIALSPSWKAYQLRGQIHRDSGDTRAAVSDFEKACRLDPTSQESFADLAGLEWKLHHYEKARIAFIALLKLNPGRFVERSNLAEVYLDMHRPTDALSEIKISLKTDIDRGGKGHALLGYTLLELKQYNKALEALNFAIAKDDYNFKALKARARVYDMLEKKDLAERDRKQLKDEYAETYANALFSTK